ncbi:MAG TPA: HAMP domain-containing protein [Sorangium sp.]|nr:HAMP domain-containing protein [Sorangium sp.]
MTGSIRVKALLLLVLFAVAPLAAVVALVLPSYGQAVRSTEEQSLLVVANELSDAVRNEVEITEAEARSVANVLAEMSRTKQDDKLAIAAVQGVMRGTRIDALRFEVPAKVDIVLSKPGADKQNVPYSDEASRQRALAQGVAFRVVDESRGALVVPLPKDDGNAKALQGYVVAPVYLRALNDALAATAARRHMTDVRILVVDRRRRLVARYNNPRFETGADTSALPFWAVISAGDAKVTVGVKTEFDDTEGHMVAAIHQLSRSGWAVAVWRPEAVALAGFHRVRSFLIAVALGALVVALILGLFSSRAITQPLLELKDQAKLIGQRRWGELAPAPTGRDEIGDLGRAVRHMADDLQSSEQELQRELKLRGDLSRFMSQDVVDGIVNGEHPLELGGQRAQVSVVFADMVAFTAAAEQHPPETVVAMLNELFTVMTEVVFRHGGTVDKFIGDCIMGVWGAPIADDDHAMHALEAAEDMMSFLETASDQWREKYGVEVRLAIGVNSGEAIVGNIGSTKRMEYTVVGDMVNVAARLETIAAPNQILVGEKTQQLVEEEFELRLLGERKLTGRAQAIKVYELQTD